MKKLLFASTLLGFICFWSGVALHTQLVHYISPATQLVPTLVAQNSTPPQNDELFDNDNVPHANIHMNHDDTERYDPTMIVTTPVPGDSELAASRNEKSAARAAARRAKKKPPIIPAQPPATTSVTTTQPTVPTPTPLPSPAPAPAPKPTPTTTAPVNPPIISSPTSTVASTKIKWGAFAGSNPTTIADFESRISVNPNYLAYFVHWGNGGGALPNYLADYVYKKDRTLVLFWEASDYVIGSTNQPNYSYRSILAGNWDNYFKDFTNQLATYKGPVILVPFSELNGNWTPWSGTKNGNTPAEAVAAWRYIHGFFAQTPNVKFGLAVNAPSVPDTPENQIANYYPGDAYVDYVGVDGFNFDKPWMTFNELFARPLSILEQYNKPIMIFSFGSAPGPEKAAWLNEGLNVVLPNHPKVVAWVYFNQDKERNWLLWSDSNTFSVFTKYITQ